METITGADGLGVLGPIWVSRHERAATRALRARNRRLVDDADELIAILSPDRKGGTEDTIRRT